MSKVIQDINQLSRQVIGREISRLSLQDDQHLYIHFVDGGFLLINSSIHDISIGICPSHPDQPTKRQREYLHFIDKYIKQFGRSPAESDIQRHFLVSAPSVNNMVQTLEKRGFIARQPGVARSIKLLIQV